MKNNSTVKQLSDEELALRAGAGSHFYFEELVYRYSQRLFFYLRPKIATDQDTEDLVQETFLKIYRSIGRYDPDYKFSTWIYTTAGRLAISYYRKKREVETGFEAAADVPGPAESMIRRETFQNIWSAARALQKDQYRALYLRYVEDMPVKEIARVMKKTGIHVRVLLHRARLKLVEQVPAAQFNKSFAGVQGAVFQKRPLVAEGKK
ncbi:MAG: sigma-70 family RNA polymerase sigma factor [Candidatus Aminicenantes bacterium]|nr:sigma-70 family RNA polymerase sigma factor [Candidatus Aminicenantes bacterium]